MIELKMKRYEKCSAFAPFSSHQSLLYQVMPLLGSNHLHGEPVCVNCLLLNCGKTHSTNHHPGGPIFLTTQQWAAFAAGLFSPSPHPPQSAAAWMNSAPHGLKLCLRYALVHLSKGDVGITSKNEAKLLRAQHAGFFPKICPKFLRDEHCSSTGCDRLHVTDPSFLSPYHWRKCLGDLLRAAWPPVLGLPPPLRLALLSAVKQYGAQLNKALNQLELRSTTTSTPSANAKKLTLNAVIAAHFPSLNGEHSHSSAAMQSGALQTGRATCWTKPLHSTLFASRECPGGEALEHPILTTASITPPASCWAKALPNSIRAEGYREASNITITATTTCHRQERTGATGNHSLLPSTVATEEWPSPESSSLLSSLSRISQDPELETLSSVTTTEVEGDSPGETQDCTTLPWPTEEDGHRLSSLFDAVFSIPSSDIAPSVRRLVHLITGDTHQHQNRDEGEERWVPPFTEMERKELALAFLQGCLVDPLPPFPAGDTKPWPSHVSSETISKYAMVLEMLVLYPIPQVRWAFQPVLEHVSRALCCEVESTTAATGDDGRVVAVAAVIGLFFRHRLLSEEVVRRAFYCVAFSVMRPSPPRLEALCLLLSHSTARLPLEFFNESVHGKAYVQLLEASLERHLDADHHIMVRRTLRAIQSKREHRLHLPFSSLAPPYKDGLFLEEFPVSHFTFDGPQSSSSSSFVSGEVVAAGSRKRPP